jgi:tRNA threonylcarbamoyladenosine biosynthesis protein TsaE
MAQYQGRLPIYHIDLYRVDSVEEALDLGLDDYLWGDGVSVVEWADRAAEMFPPEAMRISLEYGEGETDRVITIHPATERHRRLLKGLPGAVEAGTPGDPPARGGR